MVVDLDEVLLQLIVHLSFHKTLFWQVQQPMQYLFATCSNVIWLFIFFPLKSIDNMKTLPLTFSRQNASNKVSIIFT